MAKATKRKRKPEPVASRSPKRQASSRALFEAKRKSGPRCDVCGIYYGELVVGLTFLQAKRDLIAMDRYARRASVLGYMHGIKHLAWTAHVDECETHASMRRAS